MYIAGQKSWKFYLSTRRYRSVFIGAKMQSLKLIKAPAKKLGTWDGGVGAGEWGRGAVKPDHAQSTSQNSGGLVG